MIQPSKISITIQKVDLGNEEDRRNWGHLVTILSALCNAFGFELRMKGFEPE